MKIAVVGAGNGGQAIAGYLATLGIQVFLYDRSAEKVDAIRRNGGIKLSGCINEFGRVAYVSASLQETVRDAELIMITTIANAHTSIAREIAPYIEDEQVIILNPGRTCGAIAFKQALKDAGCNKHLYLGEAQTLVYACRIIENGNVDIIGIKDEVLLSGLPSSDTDLILSKVSPFFPCFKKAHSVLRTSLENTGAILHTSVCLFNAATIERQDDFWFYRDMTEQVAGFIERLDHERLSIGKAFGCELLNVSDWIKYAYRNTEGDSLCERMKSNPAYRNIKAPGSIFTRQLTEDIPTGIIPMIELGKAAGLETPIMQSVVTICSTLLHMDFCNGGRTLKNLGLDGMNVDEILTFVDYA